MSKDVRVHGVAISRPDGRVWADVTTAWSAEVLAMLEDHGVEALGLGADSEVKDDRGLAGLERLTSLRVLHLDWARVPAIPEAALQRLEDLSVIGRSGHKISVESIPRLRSLEYRPGRVVGALAELPDLEAVVTRGMPEGGFGAFDSCAALRVVRMNGRGVTTLACDAPPRAVVSVILSGIALSTLDGIGSLPVINDLTVEGGRAAAGLTLDLAPLRSAPSLRVFAASGYGAYEAVDSVEGTLEGLYLGDR